ncbi:unnamed protein product [Effrenium voratum]|nr:unnamed protein product [Effrenium voratum]
MARVVVRIRPERPAAVTASGSSGSVQVALETGLQFDVDEVLADGDAPEANQEKAFQSLGLPLLQDALRGRSHGLLAFGGAWSGKSYTLLGTHEAPGLVPRLAAALGETEAISVWFSAVEIFDDHCQDLLATGPLERKVPSFVHHPRLGVQLVGATEMPVEQDIQELVSFALKRRALLRTCLHSATNRSHQLFTLRVESAATSARLCFFDLAAADCAVPSLDLRSLEAEEPLGLRLDSRLLQASCPLTLAVTDCITGAWRCTVVATVGKSAKAAAAALSSTRLKVASDASPRVQRTRQEQLSLLQEEVVLLKAESELALRGSLIVEFNTRPDQKKLARERAKTLEWCGLTDPASEDDVTPYLANMSEDATLAGRLVYHLPRGERTSIGSDPDNAVVVDGLGVLPNLCSIVNLDDSKVTLSRPDFARAQILLNGRMLSSESVALEDKDRICIGRAQLLRLHIPKKGEPTESDVLSQDTSVLPASPPELGDLSQLCAHSDSLRDLQYYVKDLLPKLAPPQAVAILEALRKVCYHIDEANMITREVRPEDHMQFEVELVWDIFRKPEEVLVIRLMSYAHSSSARGTTPSGQLMHYSSVARFLERLELLRDAHRGFGLGFRVGASPGRGASELARLKDPPSISAMRQHLTHASPAPAPIPEGVPELKAAIAVLRQELQEKSEDLERKSEVIAKMSEEMQQIFKVMAEEEEQRPTRKVSRDSEENCTMSVSASSGSGCGSESRETRSRGFRQDKVGRSLPSHAPVLLSQSSLTPPGYYRDLRRGFSRGLQQLFGEDSQAEAFASLRARAKVTKRSRRLDSQLKKNLEFITPDT